MEEEKDEKRRASVCPGFVQLFITDTTTICVIEAANNPTSKNRDRCRSCALPYRRSVFRFDNQAAILKGGKIEERKKIILDLMSITI